MLLPGTYSVTIQVQGYARRRFQNITVVDGPATRLDVELIRADLNGDGVVRLDDFAAFGGRWLDTNCGSCGFADLTGDGNVLSDDLVEFAASWLGDAR